MQITIDRKYKLPKYTIGKMYINGEYFCDTLEDADRGLLQSMSEAEILNRKKYGETAIPAGLYIVRMSKSAKFNRILPEILNVKGYSGVRIHRGNTANDTLGCILVGYNKARGMVLDSTATERELVRILKNENNITLHIQ